MKKVQGADACLWREHDVAAPLSLHKIARLRDNAKIDHQPCALTPPMSSQIHPVSLFLSGPSLQPGDQVSVAVLQLRHFTATFIVARQV